MIPEKCSHSDVDHINEEFIAVLTQKYIPPDHFLIPGFLRGLLFNAEDRGGMCLWNVG